MADDVVRDIPEEMVEKATFWNERVGRVEPLREGHPLRWWYGPLKASSDPNQKWCHDCYGVVEESNGRRWCRLCKASQSLLGAAIEAKADAAARELAPAWVRYPVGISSIADLRALIGQVLSAALAGRQVVDDWAAVETAVRRGIEQFARAYWIPANNLHGGDPDRRDRMAARWAEGSAEFVTACIREDLRKAAAGSGSGEG